MRAVIVTNGNIAIQDVPRPEPPAAGQVCVRVHAVSVNPVDWKRASAAPAGSSVTPGRDFAGVIDAVGPSVAHWRVGDAVIGVDSKSYAEYVLVPATSIAAKPARMSFDEAAGLGVAAETAYRAMVTVGDVQQGQRVLIHGGAGGVGSAAVQIAKARGAHVMTTASARNHEFLKSLGADETIDYQAVRVEDCVDDVDLMLNTVNADDNVRLLGVLKRGGLLVSIVGPPPAERCAAAGIRCAVTGSANGQVLGEVAELVNAGRLRVSVAQRMPLADVARAWEESRARHVRGKIILEVAPASAAG
jgi:NADPH:quinone reductase-like Zn-dependent oxidoreductase